MLLLLLVGSCCFCWRAHCAAANSILGVSGIGVISNAVVGGGGVMLLLLTASYCF